MQSFSEKYAKAFNWMGTRMKRVRLGGAKVVTDFFITFCLRVPQATVEVVLIRVMNGVAGFWKWIVLREVHRVRSFGRYTLHS